MYITHYFESVSLGRNLKLSLSFLLLFTFSNLVAQTDNKDIRITSCGSGETFEEAERNALKSALEKAFGAFISSKTEMLNDQIVSDNFVSVSNGYIKSYVNINNTENSNGKYYSTLLVTVSLDKLAMFAESHGENVEFNGSLFYVNIQQKIINELSEIDVVTDLVGMSHEILQNSFDYKIKVEPPKAKDASNLNWVVPLKVSAVCNENLGVVADNFYKILKSIELSDVELQEYIDLHKNVYPVIYSYNNKIDTIYLRREESFKAINTLISTWPFYTHLFLWGNDVANYLPGPFVHNNTGGDFMYLGGDWYYLGSMYKSKKWNNDPKVWDYVSKFELNIHFPNVGTVARIYSYEDSKTIDEIKKLSEYQIKPWGLVSKYEHGGFVIEPTEGKFKVGLGTNSQNIVTVLSKDFPAFQAGIEIGDKILKINDLPYSFDLLVSLVQKGAAIKIYFEHSSEFREVNLIPKYIPPTKGLVISLFDLNPLKVGSLREQGVDFNTAIQIADKFVLSGYDDWRLPEKEEFVRIYNYLLNIGGNHFDAYKYQTFGYTKLLSLEDYGYWGADASRFSIYYGFTPTYNGSNVGVRLVRTY
jgi:hypothetical protein